MTAKEWKDKNPNLDGNIRDHANILQLVILSNLENLNAEMIERGASQKARLESLNKIAKKQYNILQDNNSIKRIEALDDSNLKKLLSYSINTSIGIPALLIHLMNSIHLHDTSSKSLIPFSVLGTLGISPIFS